jgi:hypothetical protein
MAETQGGENARRVKARAYSPKQLTDEPLQITTGQGVVTVAIRMSRGRMRVWIEQVAVDKSADGPQDNPSR